MKNLTQRSKIVLAIVGVLVIVVVAVAVFAQVGGSELFGATTPPVINPANPTITVGQTALLSTASVGCNWSTVWMGAAGTQPVSLSGVAGPFTTVRGVNVGSQRVIAKCSTGQASTNVTVLAPPTPTPTPIPLVITVGADTGKNVPVIGYGEYLTLCANDETVRPENWTVLSPYPSAEAIEMVGSPTHGCIAARGNYHGTASAHAEFKATNAAGSQGSVVVYENDAISITPAYPVINVGQSITMSMTGAEATSTWSIYRGCENLPAASCPVRLSATSGQSVTITAQAPGTVLITCNRFSVGGWGETGLTQVIVH